jgi:hypothetical protein
MVTFTPFLFSKKLVKIIQIDADYFTSHVLLFVFTSHTAFVCSNSPLYSLTTVVVCPVRHPFGYEYSTFTSVVSGSISFRLSLLHFHYYGVCVCVCVCPVRHPFDYHYFTFTTTVCVCVRFDTLSIIIISLLLLWCVSGSTPFRLSLFHFYYGVRRVRYPFDYHYFTFTMVSVRFGFTLSIVITFLFSYGVVRFCHPF